MDTRSSLSDADNPKGKAPPSAHLVQLDIAWENARANHERVRGMLDAARVCAGDFILLPEMFGTGFSFNISRTTSGAGATLQFLLDLADRTGCIVQGGRTVSPPGGRGARNVMSVVAPGQRLVCEYAKQKLFSIGGEHKAFEQGSETVVFEWPTSPSLRVMPAICYDLRFPEVFRKGLAAGAECIAIGACWPVSRAHHWRALLIARAIENQCFVLGVNRVGEDPIKLDGSPGLRYGGGSIVVSPRGEVLGELGEKAGVLSVPVEAIAVREWREAFPAWRDAAGV